MLTEKDEKKTFFGKSRAKELGGSTANQVTKVKYKEGIGEGDTQQGFWKVGTADGAAANMVGSNKEVGQSRTRASKKDPSKTIMTPDTELKAAEDPRMGARAVASSRLDKALGTNVLADEAFAERNGQLGNVSAQVPGRALVENKNDKDGKLLSQNYGDVAAGNDPAYQRSMSDLAVVDYLSGQVDRHGGNIFYDPATGGGVKGIDNDLAFGQWNHQNDKGLCYGNGLDALPKQIDAETAGVIRDMTEDEFRASIAPRPGDPQSLAPAEIDKTLERFRTLKLHIAGLEKQGALIQQWDDQTFADACNDPTGTYIGRQVDQVKSTKGTGNSAQDSVTTIPKADPKKAKFKKR